MFDLITSLNEWYFFDQVKPQPEKISVSELLQKVQKPEKKHRIKAGISQADKNCKDYLIFPLQLSNCFFNF